MDYAPREIRTDPNDWWVAVAMNRNGTIRYVLRMETMLGEDRYPHPRGWDGDEAFAGFTYLGDDGVATYEAHYTRPAWVEESGEGAWEPRTTSVTMGAQAFRSMLKNPAGTLTWLRHMHDEHYGIEGMTA